VAFDRAADYYDATRSLPDEARDGVTNVLAAELDGRGPALEIGVGTGRIALPLRDRGITLTGADISEPMLRRLIANAGGNRPFPLLLADATRLPVADGAFGAVVACHVLHLIPDWRAAVDEVMRTLRPGGVLLADFGDTGRKAGEDGDRPPWEGALTEILARHGISRNRHGVTTAADVAAYLGFQARALPQVPVTFTRTLGRTLADMERQIYSWTWPYPADRVRAACADTRTWAALEDFDLDAEVPATQLIKWQAFLRSG
jgi:ubiquinone/menaquinone biosynthesis C-methylase UbiE